MSVADDIWASGDAYEPYVGRWSRPVARQFLAWIQVAPAARWLDVGCGTGALSDAILSVAQPASVTGVDRSAAFVAYASGHVRDQRASFEVGDAQELPFDDGSFDAVVSALLLNFLPQPERGVAEMVRVARPGGVVAAYVWDYAGEMQLIRSFWDAAVALDPSARGLDEGRLFPLCSPERLEELFRRSSLEEISVRSIDVPTDFSNFDDFWRPFLGGQGPAPSYAMSLDEARRAALRDRIRDDLPVGEDGSIRLVARAWAVRGQRP